MSVPEITAYLDKKLRPQLFEFGVSEAFLLRICETVEMQMLSALSHWLDTPFRKALLLTVSEESPFYEPFGKPEVKGFVVLTLRNSPFETLQSSRFISTGLAQALSDEQIKAVTGDAITYFNRCNLEQMAKAIVLPEKDYYGETASRCPVAWNALTYLASSAAKQIHFPFHNIEAPYELEATTHQTSQPTEQGFAKRKAVLDGYDMTVDTALVEQLRYIAEVQGAFYIDCFKMLSRNMNKLLDVMEFLLTHGCAFVTSNYYITNGHAERRLQVLRAAACKRQEAEIQQHIAMTSGLGRRHAAVLKHISAHITE